MATKLTGTDKIIQLLECCDDQLRRSAVEHSLRKKRSFHSHEESSCKRREIMVARVTLHNLCQDRDKPIHAYGARLRGQTSVSKLTTPCVNCEAEVIIQRLYCVMYFVMD